MPVAILLLVLAACANAASAAPECWVRGDRERAGQRASPLDSTSVALGGETIKVCYSRPSMRGREIMGGLVPLGQPWRLGADEATTIHVPVAVHIAGVAVAAGSYSLYAVPEGERWTIAINRNAQRWGIPLGASVQEQDVGRGEVPVERLEEPVERLTMTLEPRGSDTANLVIAWERTQVRVPIERR